jgi:hypothetical protein
MARPTLAVDRLEDRLALSLTFRFDYSHDTAGFFTDPARRAVLEQAGADLAGRIGTTLDPIAPAGGNTWTATFFDPATGGQAKVPNLRVAAGEVVVYVGGRQLKTAEAGEGGSGGYSAAGDANWLNEVKTRGQSGFSLWGGAIAFDTTQPWVFGTGSAPVAQGQTDFYTVATHELGHVLGIGTAQQFNALISGNKFTGAAATAANGGTAPALSADLAHWAQGVTSDGRPASLEPYLISGQRYGFTTLDYAALSDIGWQVSGGSVSPPVSPPTTVPPVVPPVSPPVSPPAATPAPVGTPTVDTTPAAGNALTLAPTGCTCGQCQALAGAGGTVRLVNLAQSGTPTGPAFQPFPGFTGEVRASLADVTGDGKPELVMVTGPGDSLLRVIDPETRADVVPAFHAFGDGFGGGLYLATADVTGDGKAEIVVCPDDGGGPRVTAFAVNGGIRTVANFFGIQDPDFRGGARVAAADLNGDGVADLVVGAGVGGGPRVATYDGRSLGDPNPRHLTGDFFAFGAAAADTLRNGVYVAAGDLDGDGRAEVVFGAGPASGPRVTVLSGAAVMRDPVSATAAPMADFAPFAGGDGARVSVTTVGGKPALAAGTGADASPMLRLYPAAGGRWAGGDPGNGVTFPLAGLLAGGGVYVG